MATPNQLLTLGRAVSKVPVHISFKIIDLFSAGLYSSPTKAIEELVANSYDAHGTCVNVVLPGDFTSNADAIVWVADNGTGMDAAGLAELWRIGESSKREPSYQSNGRPPIGRFGIGKLATYVLAHHLTYVTKVGGVYRAVSIDFSSVPGTPLPPSTDDTATDAVRDSRSDLVELDLRELTEKQAVRLLEGLTSAWPKKSSFSLFGENAGESWTVVGMAKFKPFASSLKLGRLRWILSTAFPLSPAFNLFLNDDRLRSSKSTIPVIEAWKIGVHDAAAEKLDCECQKLDGKDVVALPDVGAVSGDVSLHEAPLTGGHSAEVGRSHGVFVMVRGRLVNTDDAMFGIPQLSHGVFARTRMVVHADGLDPFLRSTRENVFDNDAARSLRRYIEAKLNEVRARYNQYVTERARESNLANRAALQSVAMARTPLVSTIRAVLEGKAPPLVLTRLPPKLPSAQRAELAERLESLIGSEEALIKDFRFDPLGVDQPVAQLDAATGSIIVNTLHPFVANYADHAGNMEPFLLIGAADIVTEAYLRQGGMDAEDVTEVLKRRDKFLRALVYDRELSAPLVIEWLNDAVIDEAELEKSVADGMRVLGYGVTPLGGSGKPDGLAEAKLGMRGMGRADYVVAYDAKSSAKPKVKAKDLNVAGVLNHRTKFGADYSMIVAAGFEGEDDESSTCCCEAKECAITLVRKDDFVLLLWAASTRRLGLTKLKELFEKCRTPAETHKWIEDLLKEPTDDPPWEKLLKAVWELQTTDIEPVRIAALRMTAGLRKYRLQDIQDWLGALSKFAGRLLEIESDAVYLNAPPDQILRVLRLAHTQVPAQVWRRSVYAKLPPSPMVEG